MAHKQPQQLYEIGMVGLDGWERLYRGMLTDGFWKNKNASVVSLCQFYC